MDQDTPSLDDLRTENYPDFGCCLVRQTLPEEVLEPVRRVIGDYVDGHARSLLAAGIVERLHESAPFEERLARLYADTGRDLHKWGGFLFRRKIYDLALHPGMLDPLVQILGPEITFHSDQQCVPKLPDSKLAAFPWHQDTLYYGWNSRHMHIVTAWVPLVETGNENGCLWVIPGSHLWGLIEGTRGPDGNVRVTEDVEAKGLAMPVPMQPGDVMFMSNLTFHGSGANRTKAVRWSLDFGYSTTLGSRPTTPAERSSYAYVKQALARVGRRPIIAHSAKPGKRQTFDDIAEAGV
jgi:hypothetical protein